MTESEFSDLVDETFESLEEALDQVEEEIDYETSGGVLTVEFDNDTTMVFSRQPATLQLWMAARSGGFHFEFNAAENDWSDTRSGQLLKPFVVQQMAEQGDVDLTW
jgi:iron-sulfur cluster assembly protein CyaY